jgi:allophanate hydrolase subunit 2
VEETFPGNGVVGPADASWLRFGVPSGGPCDEWTAALAIKLLGDSTEEYILEISNPCRLKVLQTTPLCLFGAKGNHRLNDEALTPTGTFVAKSGDTLSLAPGPAQSLVYLAVPGLHATSGNLFQALSKGQVIRGKNLDSFKGVTVSLASESETIEIDCLLCADSQLQPGPYQKSFQTNRIGTRLIGQGPQLPGYERSRPCVRGAIQATPSGELIVHGPDGPTIGGYQIVGAIAKADWGKFSQLGPLTDFSFRFVDLDEARRKLIQRNELLERANLLEPD